jgi:Winged helix-turn helix
MGHEPTPACSSLVSGGAPTAGAGLHSSDAFPLRRCQILLASARGQRPATIARNLGCATQSVRKAIHAFNPQGLSSLHAQSRRPQRPRFVFDAATLGAGLGR